MQFIFTIAFIILVLFPVYNGNHAVDDWHYSKGLY